MPKVEFQVSDTKDNAKSKHNEIQECIDELTATIYTDGSGIKGKVSAAAYSPSLSQTNHQYLGTESQYKVFAGELVAMQLAIETLWNDGHKYYVCQIYSDSQAAIKAINRP